MSERQFPIRDAASRLPVLAGELSFACPFCQVASKGQTLTPLNTNMAHHMDEAPGGKVRWVGIKCPVCNHSLTFEATRVPNGGNVKEP